MRLLSTLFLFCCLASCRGGEAAKEKTRAEVRDTVAKSKYRMLEFMVDEKPSIALIDTTFKNFPTKKEFPLSLFITVNTADKDAKGYPTSKESVAFNALEDQILVALAPLATCYVGKTTMSGYRDLIFYIATKDQKQISEKLAAIQKTSPRVKSFVFEQDPDWEAVSEFYKALDKTK
jgi:hypothetical protein